ncbi:AMP-binding protein [Xenophilus azovorans]|uniref:AMP-binding protein n=1 Tax=Xenophilus azovorans TaxID=151755 RepID=UPI0009FBD6D8|nr:AMP-binding protein [Xenophilus azovorans]
MSGEGDFAALLEGDPQHRAIVCEGFSATRGELREASLRAAALLHAMGLRRGDAVCVWLPDGGAWLQLLFACAHLGVLMVPVSTRLRRDEARHIVASAQARAIFVPRQFLNFDYPGTARAIQAELPGVREVRVVDVPERFIPVERELPDVPAGGQPDDPLCTFSTSGTTGRPKLAVHSQGGIARHALNVARRTEIGPGSVMLCGLSLYGVLGFVQMAGALAGGAPCVFLQVFDAGRAAQAIRAHGVTHLFGSDGMLAPIWDALGPAPTTLRWCGFAEFAGLGAAVVARAERDWGVRAFGLYGASECFALAATGLPGEDPETRRLPGGSPIAPGIAFRIVDLDAGEPLADGEKGELQMRGYHVMQGYLHNPDATRAAFTADGWLRTGDLAVGRGGRFVYLSRLKDSLRLKGYLVDPSEIEAFLGTHAAVEDAQVVAVTQPGIGDVAVAFVRTNGAAVQEAELLRFCKAGMANYKVPQRILQVADYPSMEGPNGTKILKNKLREIAEAAMAQPQGEKV